MKRDDVSKVNEIAAAIGKDRQTVAQWVDEVLEANGSKGATGNIGVKGDTGPVGCRGVPYRDVEVVVDLNSTLGLRAVVKVRVTVDDHEGTLEAEARPLSVVRLIEPPTLEQMEVAVAQSKLDDMKRRIVGMGANGTQIVVGS